EASKLRIPVMNVVDFNSVKRNVEIGDYALTEDGIALAFTAIHKNDLRYDHDRGRWYKWNGNVWREERTRLHSIGFGALAARLVTVKISLMRRSYSFWAERQRRAR